MKIEALTEHYQTRRDVAQASIPIKHGSRPDTNEGFAA